MKAILSILPLAAVTLTLSAPIPVPVPDADEPRLAAICEQYRQWKGYAPATFPLPVCLLEMIEETADRWEQTQIKEAARLTERADMRAARIAAQAVHDARDDLPRVMRCGDGIVDVDTDAGYLEECDPPGRDCSAQCMNEAVIEPGGMEP